MRRFYVVEYVDEEGDQVVKHVLLEPEEAAKLIENMAKKGVMGSVSDLTQQPETSSVISKHEEAFK